MRLTYRALTFLLIASMSAFAACGGADSSTDTHESVPHHGASMSVHAHDGALLELAQAQRPELDLRPGWQTPKSYARSQSPLARIWWVESGEDAPPLADTDLNGVPDYVDLVEARAHDVLMFIETSGWRAPLSDTAFDDVVLEDRGGDGLFDIYLIDFPAADGRYIREQCHAPEGILQCAGVAYLENDFAPRHAGYASVEEAVSVVVSHELFHAVQAAYGGDSPGWWSEGTATWFEESYDPAQSDFERLASLYFPQPERRLNDLQRGPGDGFAYGGALFVYALVLTHGEGMISRVFELLVEGGKVEDALDRALGEVGESLAEAFSRFAMWNAMTGSRAVPNFGYPQAAQWPEVPSVRLPTSAAVNWAARADPLTAGYALLTIESPMSLMLLPGEDDEPPRVDLMRLDDPSAVEQVLAQSQLDVETSGDYMLVVTATSLSGSESAFVAIRPRQSMPATMDDPVVDMPADMAPVPDMGGDVLDMSAENMGAEFPADADSPITIFEPTESTDSGGCSQSTGVPLSLQRMVPPLLYFVIWFALIAIRRRALQSFDSKDAL